MVVATVSPRSQVLIELQDKNKVIESHIQELIGHQDWLSSLHLEQIRPFNFYCEGLSWTSQH